MKQLFILISFFCFGTAIHAQYPSFSRSYYYSGDTAAHTESVSALMFDSSGQTLFFCSTGTRLTSGTSYTVFYKTNMLGDVLTQTIDSLQNGNVSYTCVEASKDSQYLYWAGNSYVQGDTASLSWKIRKTDKDLNVIWDRLYPASSLSNTISNIKSLDSSSLMLLCFDYTKSNTLGMPVKASTMFMRKIDSAGNIIADYHPVDWPNTDAWGMEPTSDGGFVINGTTDSNGYILRTDSVGTHLSHQFYGSNGTKIRFLAMGKQPEADSFFHAGQIIENWGQNSDALGLKTDSLDAQTWQQQLTKGYHQDTFFAVAIGRTGSNVVYAGVSKSTFVVSDDLVGQMPGGHMVKMDKDGNIIWDKSYRIVYQRGYNHYLYKAISLPDGGYIAAGSLTREAGSGALNQTGAWLLRVDSNGCYNPECREPEFVAIRDVATQQEAINLFPNPSTGSVYLLKSDPFPIGTIITLTNAAGKILRTLESPSGKTQQVYQLEGSLLPGVYFIRITMGGMVLEKKLILTF